MKWIFVSLLDDLILGFCYSNLWTRSCTDYRKANRVIIDVHINLIKYNCKINPKMKTSKIITKNYFCAHHKNRTNILNCYFSKQTNNLAYQAKYPLIGNFYYFPKTVFCLVFSSIEDTDRPKCTLKFCNSVWKVKWYKEDSNRPKYTAWKEDSKRT